MEHTQLLEGLAGAVLLAAATKHNLGERERERKREKV
jgi:hypothetical protein